MGMVGNYIRIGLRQLGHQNVYSLVSLFGITLSITASILLFLYLRNEFMFDQFDSDIPVYRVASDVAISGNHIVSPTSPSALGPSLPYSTVRIRTQPEAIIQYKNKLFHEDQIYNVDNSFFDIFPLELLQTRQGPLLSISTIILTQTLSNKIFGDKNPIDEKIRFNGKARIVSGVVKDPYQSHLNFSGLVVDPSKSILWTSFSDYTYIKTNDARDDIREHLARVYKEKMEPFFTPNNSSCLFFLQPVEEIHLQSNLRGELDVNGNIAINFALLLIGVFMLVVAGMNYTNLSTTRSIHRAKEIAIRKSVGSYRHEIFWQFVVESILLVFFGVFLSLITIDLIFPYLHFVTYSQLYDISLLDWQLLVFILFVVIVIGLMGSIYPAYEMARFNVSEILNGSFQQPGIKLTKRRILLFVQFSISVILIICTWVVRQQITYINQIDLGYNPKQLMSVIIPDISEENSLTFLKDLSTRSEIVSASTSGTIPGDASESLTSFYFETEGNSQQILVKYFHADENFISGMEITLVEGENISGDRDHQILINQTLANQLKNIHPIGMKVRVPTPIQGSGVNEISGVVNDIHLQSLHKQIQPLAILFKPVNRYALIRFTESSENNVKLVKASFQNSFHDFPFDYQFIDDRLESLYDRDVLTGRLFGIFAIITTALALMGMFALSFYTSEIRKQEIGIRKINGASIGEILLMINKEYFFIVTIASIVALPVAYYLLDLWLAGFVYKVDLNGYLFLVVVIVSLFVAMVTVSINTLKAAHSKIVTSIKR